MMIRAFCVLAVLLMFQMVAYADDTVYCPNNETETAKQCAEMKAYVQKAQALIAKWERNKANQTTYSLVPWVKKSSSAYKKWAKPTQENLNGVHLPVAGTYRGSNGIVYLYVPNQNLKDGLTARYGSKGKAASEYKKIRNRSQSIMKHRLPPKLAKYKRSLQKAQIFLAQCCGHRWTTDGPGTTAPSQQGGSSGGDGNSINLLDVIADPAN